MNKKFYILFTLVCLSFSLIAQESWEVIAEENDNLSIIMFDEELELSGQIIYDNSCKSCHGNPEKADFSKMLPEPGDIASESFQNQTDGSLHYKIRIGRGAMPKFEDALDSEEVWNLVAYIRSFNKNYIQKKPNLEGIVIPKFSLALSFDENIDKLVVKTIGDDNNPMSEVELKAYIKGSFGNYLLGKTLTNEMGIGYFNVDAKMPGDAEGKLEVIVKARKGYGSAKTMQKMIMVQPSTFESAIKGRHLWSTAKQAPIWLKVTFFFTIISIWLMILYVVFGLKKLKKYS